MASERGAGQTEGSNAFGVRTAKEYRNRSGTAWKGRRDSVKVTYAQGDGSGLDPEYRRTREIRWEDGGTTLQA